MAQKRSPTSNSSQLHVHRQQLRMNRVDEYSETSVLVSAGPTPRPLACLLGCLLAYLLAHSLNHTLTPPLARLHAKFLSLLPHPITRSITQARMYLLHRLTHLPAHSLARFLLHFLSYVLPPVRDLRTCMQPQKSLKKNSENQRTSRNCSTLPN